jgi:NAD(P)-dependent dehydrogenase (short-subunit alcohol dehydrogenase family)
LNHNTNPTTSRKPGIIFLHTFHLDTWQDVITTRGALQIVKDEGLTSKLADKVVVITGVSSGIGIETARAMHATGAILFVTARNEAKTQPVIKEIFESDPTNKAPIHLITMENESLDTVKEAGEQILGQSGSQVNIIINNAGVMATLEGKTKDGIETQFGVCHVAHFLLFEILRPALIVSTVVRQISTVVLSMSPQLVIEVGLCGLGTSISKNKRTHLG